MGLKPEPKIVISPKWTRQASFPILQGRYYVKLAFLRDRRCHKAKHICAGVIPQSSYPMWIFSLRRAGGGVVATIQ